MNSKTKVWRVTAIITSDGDFNKTQVLSKIDFDLNRGNGIYFDIKKNIKLELLGSVEDDCYDTNKEFDEIVDKMIKRKDKV